ncbi:MAG: RagB/SusD family nutrient uptake outer membrane protein [Bacteroidales bacterium]|nr:RagB/SusD family nutrient uptake outer membrane protein [Bacteroidales bacterium]
MKKTLKTILSAAFISALASCSLQEKVYTQTDESYIDGAEMAESVLLNVYRDLGVDGIYRQYLPFVFGLPTDEGKTEGNSVVSWRAEASNAYNSSDTYVEGTWKALYAAVYDVNYFLEMMERRMPSFDEEDLEECNLFIGEAHALRALLYFELVRWFGHVPLIKTTAESRQAPELFRQADPVDVYKFIEAELVSAIEALPYVDEDNVRHHTAFRISKGGALGLLTKVYATWAGYPLQDSSKWLLAVQTARTLIESGHHGLLADFEQLWKNSGSNNWDPKESLMELSYWSPLSTDASCGRVGNTNGVRCVAGGLRGGQHIHNVLYYFNPTFLTGWKDYDKDKRFALTYADYQYKPGVGAEKYALKTVGGVKNTQVSFLQAWLDTDNESWNESWRFEYCYRLTNRKWDTEIYVPTENNQINSNYTNVNWYLLRYADVLLLYAEALNEANGGPTAEAYEAVNQVRRRAFGLEDINAPSALADLPSGLSQESFRKAVQDERGWELAGEGHRRQDLVRWGIYYETVISTYQNLNSWYFRAADYYIGALYTRKNKNELLPIPQREVDLCGFTQNPGWGGN